MLGYQVTRHWIKFGGKIFRKGDFLPENFTERDKESLTYGRRVVQAEMPAQTAIVEQVPPVIQNPNVAKPLVNHLVRTIPVKVR